MKQHARVLVCSLAAAGVLAAQGSPGSSKWVFPGRDGRLRYGADVRGNRIMDFSFAGYAAGGLALPAVHAARTLAPVPGDNTASIQAAIDQVSALAPGSDGFRGAVVLERGTFGVIGELKIAASGVVLRGGGSGINGTTLNMSGPPHRFLDITGAGTWHPEGTAVAISDPYVASGATSFNVSSAAGFKAGDAILIQRPVTDKWIHLLGMDLLERDGQKQTWMKAGSVITMDRTIASIAGNRITVDVPVSDSFDAAYLNPPGASIVHYTFPGRIERIGVE